MTITAYANNLPMAKRYAELNGIVDYFICKEGNRQWQVYGGNVQTMQGFKEGPLFKTLREAKEYCSKCSDILAKAKQE